MFGHSATPEQKQNDGQLGVSGRRGCIRARTRGVGRETAPLHSRLRSAFQAWHVTTGAILYTADIVALGCWQ